MNTTRIISGAVLMAVLLGILFSGSQLLFGGLLFVVVGLGAWEWARLSGIHSHWLKAAYTAVVLITPIFMTVAKVIPSQCLWLAIIFLIFGFLALLFVQEGRKSWLSNCVLRGVMGVMIIPVAALCVYELYVASLPALLFLFAYVWSIDILAYVFGKGFGRHKMIPLVSPGKTWEGLGGAFLGSAAVTAGLMAYLHYPFKAGLLVGSVIAVVMLIFCVMGDLLVSHLKRLEGLKDSGRLIPGHGGILDRIDSILAAAPIYFLIYLFVYFIRVF